MRPDVMLAEDVARSHDRQAAAYEYLARRLVAGRWYRTDRDNQLRMAADHRDVAKTIRRGAL